VSILDNCDDIYQLREAARRLLPRGIFEYVDRGSEDDKLLDENRAALDRLRVVPRFPEYVSRRNIATELFGKPITMPYIIAPTGTAGLVAYEGELALAKAAAKAGIPYTLATGAQTSVEKIAREVPNGRNFVQLYLWKDRELSMQFIDRAQNNGFEALFLTMDTPVSPNRAYNKANGFSFPYKPTLKSLIDMTLAPHWLFGTVGKYVMKNGGLPRFENYPEEFRTPITRSPLGDRVKHTEDLSWDDVNRLRDRWRGPLIVKGIMHPEDARIAVERGADGIVVSNHGGRNLDIAAATIDVLPSIVAEVGHKTTVLFDSWVRRGTDVVKALSLGAKAVLCGRNTLWGVAVAGEAGASKALTIIRNEVLTAMANIGVNTLDELGQHLFEIPGANSSRFAGTRL